MKRQYETAFEEWVKDTMVLSRQLLGHNTKGEYEMYSMERAYQAFVAGAAHILDELDEENDDHL